MQSVTCARQPTISLRIPSIFLLSAFLYFSTMQAKAQVWILRKPAVSPPARIEHAMAYDSNRKRVVLFGGENPFLSMCYNDTWEWDGNTWTNCSPPVSPCARFQHNMVYDAARKRVVLFGGANAFQDQWEWDGTTWTQVAIPNGPPGRYGHAMTYDTLRQRVVLHGGQPHPLALFNDIWEWDGNVWKQGNPSIKPGYRTQHTICYVGSLHRVVLVWDNSLWEWDGVNWKQTIIPGSTPNQNLPTQTMDIARQKVVQLGSSYNETTWEWDGSKMAWSSTDPPVSPSPRAHLHSMTYDSTRRRIVLFGGAAHNTMMNDTWEYVGPSVLTATGTTRVGDTITLALNAPGNEGLSYQGGSSLSSGPIRIDKRQIELGIDDVLIVSTSSVLPSIFSGYRGIIDSFGTAKAAIHIPKTKVLVGLRIHTAFVTIDPEAHSGIRSISNTEAFTIGL
jgi:hypothetical protein